MLSITDVTTMRFSEARVCEGYEMTEVDRFMAEVAEALYERDEKIADLREQAAAARAQATFERNPAGNGGASAAVPVLENDRGVGAAASHEDSAHDTCVSAVRVLEIAHANAEQLVSEATIEAGSLVTAARAAADQLTASSRDRAARVTAELAQQRKNLETELHEYRSAVLAGLAEQQSAVENRIRELQRLEVEHLTDLHGYFTDQLAQVQLRSSAAGFKLEGADPGPVATD